MRTDLNAPLGLERKPAQRRPRLMRCASRRDFWAGCLRCSWAGVCYGDDPLGGEPTAVVNTGLIASSRDAAPDRPGAGAENTPSATTPRTVASRGGSSGKEMAADRPQGQGAADDKAAGATYT